MSIKNTKWSVGDFFICKTVITENARKLIRELQGVVIKQSHVTFHLNFYYHAIKETKIGNKKFER